MQTPPVILALSALDPSGCGGLQADIETAASLGCHCSPIATSLCSTGSVESATAVAVDSTLVIEQARSVLEDMEVKAIKIGFPGSVQNIEAIHSIIQDYPNIPLIVHPAFCLWDENTAEQSDLPSAIATLLLPHTHIMVCSLDEAHILAKESDTIDATAQAITSQGCQYLLLNQMIHKEKRANALFYDEKGLIKQYEWQNRTPPVCHGAGSTLTSAIASLMAHDSPVKAAVDQGQNFAWHAVAAARQLGFRKPTPHRMYWADQNIEPTEVMPAGNIKH